VTSTRWAFMKGSGITIRPPCSNRSCGRFAHLLMENFVRHGKFHGATTRRTFCRGHGPGTGSSNAVKVGTKGREATLDNAATHGERNACGFDIVEHALLMVVGQDAGAQNPTELRAPSGFQLGDPDPTVVRQTFAGAGPGDPR
jgi:hypothetical protein